MTIKTSLGNIEIMPGIIASIAGNATTNCFGVKGMTMHSVSDGIAHLLKRENQSRGVRVREDADGGVCIDLHIAVEHGVNINSICRSIIKEVRYNVEKTTGIDVKTIDIFVDGMRKD